MHCIETLFGQNIAQHADRIREWQEIDDSKLDGYQSADPSKPIRYPSPRPELLSERQEYYARIRAKMCKMRQYYCDQRNEYDVKQE
jgi:hypothetical protein